MMTKHVTNPHTNDTNPGLRNTARWFGLPINEVHLSVLFLGPSNAIHHTHARRSKRAQSTQQGAFTRPAWLPEDVLSACDLHGCCVLGIA